MTYSQTAVQNDWSGSDRILGPVSDWENNYFYSNNIDYSDGVVRFLLQKLPAVELNCIDSTMSAPCSIVGADIDGDGDIDVIAADYNDDLIAWWENLNGLGTSWSKHIIRDNYDGANNVISCDLNSDGYMDVLGTCDVGGEMTWWENQDGGVSAWIEHPIDYNSGITAVHVADLDGDSDFDVIGSSRLEATLSWWENVDGSGLTWTEHLIFDQFAGGTSVSAGDFDNDGHIDILTSSSIMNSIDWWENSDTSPGLFVTKHNLESNFGKPVSVQTADIDGDGNLDIIGAAYLAGDIAWWSNVDGTGQSWIKSYVTMNFARVWAVSIADFGSDGDLDVLASSTLKGIYWYENVDGSGTSWTEGIIDEGLIGAYSIFASDINSDRCPDALGTRAGEDDIAWWPLCGYIPPGVMLSSILDLGQSAEWGDFSALYDEPDYTTVGYQFRSSNDYTNMGPWSDTVFTANVPLSDYLSDSTRYLQYRVFLDTETYLTPELVEVQFGFVELGIEDEGIDTFSFLPLSNPSRGVLSATISVPEEASVHLILHDVYGRVVDQFSEVLPRGVHSVSFPTLSNGVYFCSIFSEGFVANERVVFLR